MGTYLIVLFFSIIYFTIMIKTNWLSDIDFGFDGFLTGLYFIWFCEMLSLILILFLIGAPIVLLLPSLAEEPKALIIIIMIILFALAEFIGFIKKCIKKNK